MCHVARIALTYAVGCECQRASTQPLRRSTLGAKCTTGSVRGSAQTQNKATCLHRRSTFGRKGVLESVHMQH